MSQVWNMTTQQWACEPISTLESISRTCLPYIATYTYIFSRKVLPNGIWPFARSTHNKLTTYNVRCGKWQPNNTSEPPTQQYLRTTDILDNGEVAQHMWVNEEHIFVISLDDEAKQFQRSLCPSSLSITFMLWRKNQQKLNKKYIFHLFLVALDILFWPCSGWGATKCNNLANWSWLFDAGCLRRYAFCPLLRSNEPVYQKVKRPTKCCCSYERLSIDFFEVQDGLVSRRTLAPTGCSYLITCSNRVLNSRKFFVYTAAPSIESWSTPSRYRSDTWTTGRHL